MIGHQTSQSGKMMSFGEPQDREKAHKGQKQKRIAKRRNAKRNKK